MQRKMLALLTAAIAAVLVVGVAWASDDGASDDSTAVSVAETAASSPSSSNTVGTTADTTGNTGSTPDTSAGTSTTDVTVNGGSTATTVDDNGGTTGTTVDDHGGTTGTTIDDHGGTTRTTIDDDDDDEKESREPAPVNSDAKSYQVGDAGSVAIQIVDGRWVLLDVRANSGWSSEVDKARADEVEVEFENGKLEASFEAKLRDGQLRIEIERDSD